MLCLKFLLRLTYSCQVVLSLFHSSLHSTAPWIVCMEGNHLSRMDFLWHSSKRKLRASSFLVFKWKITLVSWATWQILAQHSVRTTCICRVWPSNPKIDLIKPSKQIDWPSCSSCGESHLGPWLLVRCKIAGIAISTPAAIQDANRNCWTAYLNLM